MLEKTLWTEKYRPKTVADCILPSEKKQFFQTMVDKREILNLLLSGSPGTGKTTIARAMLDELDTDYIIINGSMNGTIDTLRNEIQNFASTVSLMGDERKAVILDEADYLTAVTQAALRNFMEDFSSNCAFIMTCNSPNRIIDALKSRCSVTEFTIPNTERVQMMKEMISRSSQILKENHIEFDIKVIAALVKKWFPDFRKTINELQRYSHSGRIDTGILAENSSISDLIDILKKKKFSDMRKWVGENSDLDFSLFITELYQKLSVDVVSAEKLPYVALYLNQYDYRNAFVSNKEVNIVAMLTEIMRDAF